ncbi:N-acetylmuramoyl-L-alanine amidase [Roseomonas sp. GC11]|uniref:N-acetylmuramoyl-L-alanine amidase n=1 Tax=Roseomonas sp. GC11 TaxID=2950546 RepID=UPI00210C609A|nr:N-acetylmuramoyl-L-alanine amidase [Roseomonas sp. GC11]MCQ4158782.1 N-acetylmuramoyl-L-alanine amidase [Roseomonas sp. GC11]
MSAAVANRQATTHIVIHCSATPPKMNIGVKEIDRWHRLRGFFKIGYHFVIRRNGEIEPGRAESEIGAHVAGHNATSIGICLVGGVAEDNKTAQDNFTDKQWVALRRLLVDLRSRYPEATVLGHRDFPNVRKDCPSFSVSEWLARNPIP